MTLLVLALNASPLPADPDIRFVTVRGPIDVTITFGEKRGVDLASPAEAKLVRQTLQLSAPENAARSKVTGTVGAFLEVDASGGAHVTLEQLRGRILTVRGTGSASIVVRTLENRQALRLMLHLRDDAQVDASAKVLGETTSAASGALEGTSHLTLETKSSTSELKVAPTARLELR